MHSIIQSNNNANRQVIVVDSKLLYIDRISDYWKPTVK